MNDYIHTSDGGRIRWLRPPGAERPIELLQVGVKRKGEATIDQWLPPEPPDAA